MASAGASPKRALQRTFSLNHFSLHSTTDSSIPRIPNAYKKFILKKAQKFSRTHSEGGLLRFEIHDSKTKSPSHKDSNHFIFKDKSAAEQKIPPLEVCVSSKEQGEPSKVFVMLRDHLLGQGASGRVFNVLNLEDHCLYACKESTHAGVDLDFQDIAQERANLVLLDRCLGHTTIESKIQQGEKAYQELTFMKYFPGESLQNHLYADESAASKADSISFIHLVPLCFAVIDEVLYAHSNNLLLRDIKPENFIIQQKTDPHTFKLAFVDVGSALSFEKGIDYKSLDGTSPGYVAPELTVESPTMRPGASQAQDFYALGIVLAEILSKFSYQQHIMTVLGEIETKERFTRPLTHEEIIAGCPDIFGEQPKFSSATSDAESLKLERTAFELRSNLIALIIDLTKPLDHRISSDKLQADLVQLKQAFAPYHLARCYAGTGRARTQSLMQAMTARRRGVTATPRSQGDTFGHSAGLEALLEQGKAPAEEGMPAADEEPQVEGHHTATEDEQLPADMQASTLSPTLHERVEAVTELLAALKFDSELPDLQSRSVVSSLQASKLSGTITPETLRDVTTLLRDNSDSFPGAEQALAAAQRLGL